MYFLVWLLNYIYRYIYIICAVCVSLPNLYTSLEAIKLLWWMTEVAYDNNVCLVLKNDDVWAETINLWGVWWIRKSEKRKTERTLLDSFQCERKLNPTEEMKRKRWMAVSCTYKSAIIADIGEPARQHMIKIQPFNSRCKLKNLS